jgi:hypothetical protein
MWGVSGLAEEFACRRTVLFGVARGYVQSEPTLRFQKYVNALIKSLVLVS